MSIIRILGIQVFGLASEHVPPDWGLESWAVNLRQASQAYRWDIAGWPAYDIGWVTVLLAA